jgi:hypothetical protein
MRVRGRKAVTIDRRRWLAAVAVCGLSLAMDNIWAAPTPVVEIVAMNHPPVQSALKPLRDWLAGQGAKIRVKEIDIESADGERRVQAVGLKGHIPVVILIDGQYRHQRPDGSTVEFVSFPSGPGTPSGVKGTWSATDVEAVLKAIRP